MCRVAKRARRGGEIIEAEESRMKLKTMGVAILGMVLVMGIELDGGRDTGSTSGVGLIGLGISKAHARRGRGRGHAGRHRHRHRVVPGGARGVARRTTRRAVRRSIAGCSIWRTYWNCGGVYYAATVEDGVTVYVVVNP